MADELPDLPALDDIQDLLRFEPEEGRIWLAEERMVLLRSSELQALRKEMIESLGIDRAKGLLIRIDSHLDGASLMVPDQEPLQDADG